MENVKGTNQGAKKMPNQNDQDRTEKNFGGQGKGSNQGGQSRPGQNSGTGKKKSDTGIKSPQSDQ